ncbi:hypothetical protein PR048_022530 [Dryococelus australis]|uniref:Uncharacterized protein n=1 Tax=Dryococelus australis TaxID=614101 RepID=A0ABQ9H1C0_9NEOP|nr:hypothetical protein PR048_022530 [Dryococelus australis]
MEYYLGHEELWDLVLNSKGSTEEVTEAQHKRDTKAICKIGMPVHPQYHDTGANIVCILLERLFDIKPKYGAICDKNIGRSKEVKDARCKLEGTLIAMLLLRGLTSEFKPLRMSRVQRTTNYVKGQLLQQEHTPGGKVDTSD